MRQSSIRSRVIRQLTAEQKNLLQKELIALRLSAAKDRSLMRGLNALIPLQLVDKIIKNSSHLLTIEDVTSMSVSPKIAPMVLVALTKIVSSSSRTVGDIAAEPLGDISNQNNVR